jgi:hypothetical protein
VEILFALARMVATGFAVSSAMLTVIAFVRVFKPGLPKPDALRWLWAELRPFYLPACVVGVLETVLAGEGGGFWIWVGHALQFACWWIYKNVDDDDEDRWKRRKAKLKEKVAQLGGRLVVVPAGAP